MQSIFIRSRSYGKQTATNFVRLYFVLWWGWGWDPDFGCYFILKDDIS